MKLEDLILKKGDVVTIQTPYGEKIILINHEQNASKFYGKALIKIQCPVQYETIYEAPKQILDKEEKEYLENFLRPFKDRIKYVGKVISYKYERIVIAYHENDSHNEYLYIRLPLFTKNTMYKGMTIDKEYTLEELGLFK